MGHRINVPGGLVDHGANVPRGDWWTMGPMFQGANVPRGDWWTVGPVFPGDWWNIVPVFLGDTVGPWGQLFRGM